MASIVRKVIRDGRVTLAMIYQVWQYISGIMAVGNNLFQTWQIFWVSLGTSQKKKGKGARIWFEIRGASKESPLKAPLLPI